MPDLRATALRRRLVTVGRGFRRLPRWVRAALAVLTMGLGVYLITRPTTSLGMAAILIGAGFLVQGVLVLTVDDDPKPGQSPWWRRTRIVDGVLWVVAGLFILLFLGLTVRLLAVVIAVALMLSGTRQITGAYRRERPTDERVAATMFGIASIGFGLLALLWPDVTLLVAAVVAGARLILTGAVEAWRAISGIRLRAHARRSRRAAPIVGAALTLMLVVVAGAASLAVRNGTPDVDAFYTAPRDAPAEPGILIRSEPFTRDVPADARAWRILYTTTRGDGSPTVASGIVVVPKSGAGHWPVIDWDHGTTGYARACAPSLLEQPFTSGALFVLPQVVEKGWALVATDYIGLGGPGAHPYLIGEDAAHASLDAVRAARDLNAARLGADTVVWGHSQGGAAALWTGALAASYAPDVTLSGVAALAPAADLPALTRNLGKVTGGSVFASFVAASYTATYPDVTWADYIRPGAEPVVRAMSERCLSGPGVYVSVLGALSLTRDPEIFEKDPTTGTLGRHLAQNVPPSTITAPLLIAQGAADALVVPAAQKSYVERMRAAGERIDYRTYPGRDHVGLVQADSPLIPQLFAWTTARFGEPSGR